MTMKNITIKTCSDIIKKSISREKKVNEKERESTQGGSLK